jgi:hypothetical protein
MANMTIKSTFTLDKKTADDIRSLSSTWKVSQAEVVRKSIQIALEESRAKEARSPLTIIESLDRRKKATPPELAAFKKAMAANKKGWEV